MTEQTQMLKQVVDFQKTVFNGSFNTMTVVQERAEKVMDMVLNQATWVPKEFKDVVSQWTAAYQDGCKTFKQFADDSFEKIEEQLNITR
jgi:hypothetical protein